MGTSAGGTACRCCPCPAGQASPPAAPAGHAASRAPHCSVTGVGPREPAAGAGRTTDAHSPSPPRRRLTATTAPGPASAEEESEAPAGDHSIHHAHHTAEPGAPGPGSGSTARPAERPPGAALRTASS